MGCRGPGDMGVKLQAIAGRYPAAIPSPLQVSLQSSGKQSRPTCHGHSIGWRSEPQWQYARNKSTKPREDSPFLSSKSTLATLGAR